MIKNWDKAYNKYILYAGLIILAAYLMPTEKNWAVSFSNKHSWPYGAKASQDLISSIWTDAKVAKHPAYNVTRDMVGDDNQYLYFIVDQYVSFDSLDLLSLLDFTYDGHHVFISANQQSVDLLDTLHVDTDYYTADMSEWLNGQSISKESYRFYISDNVYTFDIPAHTENYLAYDGYEDQVLALSASQSFDYPSFVRVPHGHGYFYLHNQPMLLTNYYILKDEGKSYIEEMSSYLPDATLIWDEHYKAVNARYRRSPMHVILSKPSLKWAYWISILALLLFFLFRIKRKQRIIPVVEPPKNESKAFAETMGNLYYNTASNKEMAMKKITVLREYMVREYAMSDIQFHEDEKETVRQKSGKSTEEVNNLYKQVNNAYRGKVISTPQLKALNRIINTFIK